MLKNPLLLGNYLSAAMKVTQEVIDAQNIITSGPVTKLIYYWNHLCPVKWVFARTPHQSVSTYL